MNIRRSANINRLADKLENWAMNYADLDFDPSDFYVGIAKVPEERLKLHKAEEGYIIETDNRDMAGDVEEEMNIQGFDTGSRPDNGGDEESVYVYIYPKTQDTRETSDQD